MKKALKNIYLIIILLFLYMPILTLVVLSFNQSKSMFKWTGLSLRWYRELFSNGEILRAVWNTFSIAFCAAVAATLIGTLGAIGLQAMKKRPRNLILSVNQIPLLNADIVIGISLMLTFIAAGLYLSWGTVLLAHIFFCLPYVLLSVMPRLRQSTASTYEAALDLGASSFQAFLTVVLPEIWPGIISGFLLSFTMSVDDFVVTHFTRGAGINTISTLIYSQVRVGIRPVLFALSTLIFLVVLLALLVSNRMQRKEETA